MAEGDLRNRGLFVGGADDLGSWNGAAGRLEGLWLQHLKYKDPGRSGFLHIDEDDLSRWSRPIPLSKDVPYVLSFYYRTLKTPDYAAVTAASDQVLFKDYYALPNTGGSWWRFVAIGRLESGDDGERILLLRTLTPGRVWFDEVGVRNIYLPPSTQPVDNQFIVLDGN